MPAQPFLRLFADHTGRGLQWAARACAILGGLALLAILVATCISVVGRNLLERTWVGDFEFNGMAGGVAVALFMPWCQFRRGHILVEFFTAGASPRTVSWLDRTGALLLAVSLLVLAWRTTLGGLNAYGNLSMSMLLGLPHWWVYAGMVPPLVLTALIGLFQALWPASLETPP